MQDEGTLHMHTDILRNLTLCKGRCLVCGRPRGGRLTEEKAEVWVACTCGHVFEMKNVMVWN